MEAYVNEIRGLADCICALYISKRNIDREKEGHLRDVCRVVLDNDGLVTDFSDIEFVEGIDHDTIQYYKDAYAEFNKLIKSVSKWGKKHNTLLKYMDFSCSVYGLHRGAQDDFDAHAERLDSRIIRSSTRLAKFGHGEKSEWYEGKILSTDEALELMEKSMPEVLWVEDKKYVRCVNGYVLEEYKDDHDVLRGLYMLSIPSNFIFKCNIVQFAHIVAMRDKYSHAAPELRDMIESVLELLNKYTGGFITRELLYEIERWENTGE